jgi:F-type H+-transporting ATPase subunit beta
MNVIGEPVDEAGPIKAADRASHPPAGAVFVDNPPAQILVTGIKVIDLLALRQRQVRPSAVQGRQDRDHSGADQQHCKKHGGYSVFAGVGGTREATTSITR